MEVNKTITSILDDLFSRKILANEALSSGWRYDDNATNNYNFHRSMLYMKPSKSQTELPIIGDALPEMFIDDAYYSVPTYAIQELQDLGRQMIPLQNVATILEYDDATANNVGSFDNVFSNFANDGSVFGGMIIKGKQGSRPHQQYQRIQAQPLQQQGDAWPHGMLSKPDVTGTHSYSQLISVPKDRVIDDNITTVTHHVSIEYTCFVGYPANDNLQHLSLRMHTSGGINNIAYTQDFPDNPYVHNPHDVSVDINISDMTLMDDKYQIWVNFDFDIVDLTDEDIENGAERYITLDVYGNNYIEVLAIISHDHETRSFETQLTPLNAKTIRYIELKESNRWERSMYSFETIYPNFPRSLEVLKVDGTLRTRKGYNFQYCVALRYVENVTYTADYYDIGSPFEGTYSLTSQNTVNVNIDDVTGLASRLNYFTDSGQDADITFDRKYYAQYNGSNIKSLHLKNGMGTNTETVLYGIAETRLRLPFATKITTDVPLVFDVMTENDSDDQSASGAFYGCSSLLELPDIANQVMLCHYLLYNCSSLTSVDLANVYVSQNKAMQPFFGCYSMKSMTNVDIKMSSYPDAYASLVNLETLLFRSDYISFPDDNDRLNFDVDISNTNMNADSIIAMANSIPAGTTGKITIRISQSSSFTDTQVAELSSILQAKGWSIQTTTVIKWL